MAQRADSASGIQLALHLMALHTFQDCYQALPPRKRLLQVQALSVLIQVASRARLRLTPL